MHINNSLNTYQDYARLFLDKPFRHGIAHLKIAAGVSSPTGEVWIQPRKYTGAERAYHLIVGICELIPIAGIVVTYAVEYFKRIDNYKNSTLINSKFPIKSHQYSWYLNLALLRSAYDSATGAQKEKIKFLAANYLYNVTPKKLDWHYHNQKKCDPHFLSNHQGTPLEEYRYHREAPEQRLDYGNSFNEKLAYGCESVFILTDTTELEHFFPLKFSVIDEKIPKSDYASKIKCLLENHFSADSKDALERPLEFPILLDVTRLLEKSIQTNGNPSEEKRFKADFAKLKREFFSAQNQAIENYCRKNKTVSKSRLKNFLADNIVCISRVSIDGAAGIKMLPIGHSRTKEKQYESKLIHAVINSGAYIGAVNLRKHVADVFLQRPDVDYAIPSKTENVLYHPNKEDFTEARFFQRLLCLFGSKPVSGNCGISTDHLKERVDAIARKPHLKTMGKATVDLIQGLMNEISQEKWNEIRKDPIYSPLFQTSLFMIREHLATAEHYALADNFNRFLQEIELVHAELATLLELTLPFQEKDFGEIYKKELLGKSVPTEFEKGLKAGMGKTAVNIFSGFASIVKGNNPVLHGVHSHGCYFEPTTLMNHYFDHYMKDPNAPKVGMYLSQFNSNVDVGSTLTEYTRHDVASDIRKLLDGDRVQDKFTVVIDLTIEHYHSKNVESLLNQFKNEIKEGKINFALFSSGQKFYTLGMDNYYGSYYYLVNNGDEKWKEFDSLETHPSYRTDPLSVQWFCLATKYAPDSLSNYRQLIFDNSRYILDRIPNSLKPNSASTQTLRVNSASRSMDVSFIDLKILCTKSVELFRKFIQWFKSKKITTLFSETMAKNNILYYGRGSFGFYHHNFADFGYMGEARTIRLNLGINPEENDTIIEFFKRLAQSAY